jgi:hypothetical protein
VQLGVDGGQPVRGELVEPDVSHLGDEVLADVALVGLVGGEPQARADRRQPSQQVLADCLAGGGDVTSLVELAEGVGEPAVGVTASLEPALADLATLAGGRVAADVDDDRPSAPALADAASRHGLLLLGGGPSGRPPEPPPMGSGGRWGLGVLGRVGKLSDERGYVGTWAGNAEAGGVAGTAAHVVVNFQPDEEGAGSTGVRKELGELF